MSSIKSVMSRPRDACSRYFDGYRCYFSNSCFGYHCSLKNSSDKRLLDVYVRYFIELIWKAAARPLYINSALTLRTVATFVANTCGLLLVSHLLPSLMVDHEFRQVEVLVGFFDGSGSRCNSVCPEFCTLYSWIFVEKVLQMEIFPLNGL